MVRHVRVRGPLVTTLLTMAEHEDRSLQSMCERLLREALQARARDARPSDNREGQSQHI